jgi:signal transduction histidine kinase
VLDETGADYLRRMQSAAGRMQALIGDLLQFSRVTSRAQPFTTVDLNQVAEGVLSDLEVRLRDSGGRVEVGLLPAIEADPTQMRQLLQNLIGNAIKFARPEAPPLVRVYAEGDPESPVAAEGEDGRRFRLCVADNGIGFEEKYLDRIFTVFQRLHGRGVYEGTGIGLAICRKIVERHGGSITARSRPGEGATFIATLPLRQTPRRNGNGS